MIRDLRTMSEESAAYMRTRNEIVERALPIADNIARRFRNRGESEEDLSQVARLGLIKAVDRFDPTSEAGFLAFAVPTITGEVRRYFRDHGWALKVPRRMKELSMELTAARAELSQQLNRAPTATELAEHLDMNREDVVEGLVAANSYSTDSFDTPSRSDDGLSLSDRVGDLDANLGHVEDVATVRPLLEALPERDRVILQMRFFDNMTQTQIAEHIGVSQMQVSRLLARALATLRGQMT